MSNNKKAIHLIDLIQLKLGVFLKLDDEFSSLSAQKRPHDSYQGEGYLRLVEHLSEEVLIRGDTYNRKLHDRVAPIALKNLLEQHKWLADLKIDTIIVRVYNVHLESTGIAPEAQKIADDKKRKQLAKKKAQKFHKIDDTDSVCNYLQCISLNGKMTHFISNKCIIDENITINTSLFPDQMPSISKLFAAILPEPKNSLVYWQRFQNLTKQEKIILKMIGNGVSNIEISNQLFISKHTVFTHKKNIYKKLDINSTQELVKFSMVMDLL